MKKLLAALVLFHCQLITANCQLNYWQQEVNYTIDVSLNDTAHTLTGFEKIEYINNSPDTLKFIWFHIWPNAYKNDKTAFSDHLLGNGNTKFYFSDKEEKGYINRLDFKVNNITAATEDHPQHIDIIKLVLPAPLSPGQKILITTPFHVKLPYNFSRGGHDGQSYQVTQWYPKPAVYDKNGWHPMPYLDQGEFYSEFGSFDVKIAVPENYVVAATGELQNADEKEWLKMRANFTWQPAKQRIKTRGGSIKTVTEKFPPSLKSIKILRFKQNNVHDFAWFADKRFIVTQDTCRLASGKVVDVFTYYTEEHSSIWVNCRNHAKAGVHHYSNHVAEYPYSVVSVVQGPPSFGGGMEYPTITVIAPNRSPMTIENTIVHEIGHNWFYGILATNERDHPWMDEGINTFYEEKYTDAKYRWRTFPDNTRFYIQEAEKIDQAINTVSEKFSETNYGLTAYFKTAEWLRYLESLLGEETFKKGMQEYYKRWQFKHPQPEDFKKAMEESSGKNLDSAFAYIDKKGLLPNQEMKKRMTFVFAVTGDAVPRNVKVPTKSFLMFFPFAVGYNNYDKFMLGGMLTNIRAPFPPVPSRFQFLVIPMYAFGSKKLAGLGFANYRFYPNNGIFRKINIGLNASSFSMDRYVDDFGKKTILGFQKIVPNIRFTLREKNPRSTLERYVQFKTYLIREDGQRFFRDTIINGIDTTIFTNFDMLQNNSTIHQLQFVMENSRALYPYRAELKLEQGKDFARTTFTGKYFFNYAKGGGLNMRFFAGKFFYRGSKTSSKELNTDRYHLNMTGPNGYEDYTYSDYFAGRNEFEGAVSQQIMLRDGAFKVRTELLNDKVGKTDDWLMAVNFSTSIPSGLNPFSFLPFEVPLKIFVDIGTYSDPWKKNSTEDRFLYNAGVHIPILKETINIYVPLMYSKVYKDYILSTLPKKNRLLRVISFSIDISNFSFKKFDRNLVF